MEAVPGKLQLCCLLSFAMLRSSKSKSAFEPLLAVGVLSMAVLCSSFAAFVRLESESAFEELAAVDVLVTAAEVDTEEVAADEVAVPGIAVTGAALDIRS